jgi:hypothetical protein
MSVEQHGNKQVQGDPEQFRIPTHAPEYDERTDDLSERDESWFNRHKRTLIAAGATATALVALAAGLAIGLKGGEKGGSSPKEGQRPAATASATPGEASPSASTAETDPDSWTADNLPVSIDVDGNGSMESFTGKEQLVQALSLDVAKYPTAEDASKALLERFNTVVSWGANDAAFKQYDGYSSADHQRVGVGAAKQDVLLPAFQEALTAAPAEGAAVMETPDTWTSWVNDTAQEVNHRWIVTKGQTPYEYSCKADTSKANGGIVFNSGDAATHLKHGTIFVECTDNFDQTDLGSGTNADGSTNTSLESKQSWFVDLQPQDGKWKVIGMQAEAALQ